MDFNFFERIEIFCYANYAKCNVKIFIPGLTTYPL